jgi:hypothetical protein
MIRAYYCAKHKGTKAQRRLGKDEMPLLAAKNIK